MKMYKFGTKNASCGYFWARIFDKNYFHILNQHPRICLIGKKMPYCGIFRLEFENNMVIF